MGAENCVLSNRCCVSDCSDVRYARGMCKVHYQRDYYARNKDRIKSNVRAWNEQNPGRSAARSAAWREANPEQAREGKKRSYQKNREHYRRSHQRYYLSNRERLLSSTREWYRRNPEAAKHIKRAYKARRNGWENADFRITERALHRIWANYNGACAYCPTVLGEDFHWDHRVPLSRGGSHGEGNLVPACATCNLSKGAKTVTEWRQWQARAGL